MITFPESLTPTKYAGYYWCVDRQKLFSIKVGGELRELAVRNIEHIPYHKRPRIYSASPYYYRVSVQGKYRWLTLDYLQKLKRKDYELPLKEKLVA